VALQGNIAILVTRQTTAVSVVDVTNPAAPSLVKQVPIPGGSAAVCTAPGYVYAGDSAGVLDIIGL
jgi:hypothetical protein